MASFDEWMRAYRLADGAEATPQVTQKSYYVPAEVVFAYARGFPMRWNSLIGCRLRLPGRGFGEVLLVDDLTLWVLFDLPLEEKPIRPPELESVSASQLDRGLVAGVIFPPESDHVLARTAMIMQATQALPKVAPQPPIAPAPPLKTRRQTIKEFCKERQIECLVHFTRVENVEHIVKHGLVNRTQVDRWRKENNDAFPLICDEDRWDDSLDAICLSISFPNYKLFYEQQKKHRGTWAIIRLRSAILWELDCAFCHKNAASSTVRRTDINKRKSVEALRAMFWNTPDGLRDKLNIPDRYTTDPQAEVLVLETIPTRYIEKVYYERTLLSSGWKQKGGGHVIHTEVERRVFAPRIDYLHWQKDKNNNLNPIAPIAPPVNI